MMRNRHGNRHGAEGGGFGEDTRSNSNMEQPLHSCVHLKKSPWMLLTLRYKASGLSSARSNVCDIMGALYGGPM